MEGIEHRIGLDPDWLFWACIGGTYQPLRLAALLAARRSATSSHHTFPRVLCNPAAILTSSQYGAGYIVQPHLSSRPAAILTSSQYGARLYSPTTPLLASSGYPHILVMRCPAVSSYHTFPRFQRLSSHPLNTALFSPLNPQPHSRTNLSTVLPKGPRQKAHHHVAPSDK